MVEVAARSRSLITARLAGEQRQEVFAGPGSPLDPRAKGPNKLNRDSAILLENAEDVLEVLTALRQNAIGEDWELAIRTKPRTPAPLNEPVLTQARATITECLVPPPSRIDGLVQDSNYCINIWSHVLSDMALARLVERYPFGAVSPLPMLSSKRLLPQPFVNRTTSLLIR